MLHLFFCGPNCGTHRPKVTRSASATGPLPHTQQKYTYMRNLASSCPLCCYFPPITPYSPEQYHASAVSEHFPLQTFPNTTECCRCYRDDAISQFNNNHNVGGRTWRARTAQVWCAGEGSFSSLALRFLLNIRDFVSPGLLSKLKIPKRKMSTTQAPELRRTPSFYEGSRVTLWDCDEDDVNFPQSPLEDVSFPPRSSPDYDAVGERDSELGQDVATPMNGTAWSSDEELTPLFSSNFPRTPHPNALRGESHSDGELLEISTPSPIRPDTP